MEKLSFIGAAQRLGVTVAEIEEMIKQKKLKEVSRGKVSKEAVYAMSGLCPTGNQTKGKAGRKPNVITYEEAKEMLQIDDKSLFGLMESGELEKWEMDDGKFGITERSAKMRKKKVESREEPAEKPKMRTAFAKPIPGARVVEDVKKETEEEVVKDETTEEDTPVTSRVSAVEDKEPQPDTPTEEVAETKSTDTKKGKTEEEDIPETTNKREDIGFVLEEVMKELFPGVQLIDAGTRKAMLKKCECGKPRYSRREMKEVADVAYMKGKLSVYESMSEFKRKETV